MVTVFFILLLIAGVFSKTAQAIVPPSTMLEEDEKSTAREKLITIVDKLEKHEQENINFLKALKQELRSATEM